MHRAGPEGEGSKGTAEQAEEGGAKAPETAAAPAAAPAAKAARKRQPAARTRPSSGKLVRLSPCLLPVLIYLQHVPCATARFEQHGLLGICLANIALGTKRLLRLRWPAAAADRPGLPEGQGAQGQAGGRQPQACCAQACDQASAQGCAQAAGAAQAQGGGWCAGCCAACR